MKVNLKHLLLLSTALWITVSCSVQKRKYRHGFYVSTSHKKSELKQTDRPGQLAQKRQKDPVITTITEEAKLIKPEAVVANAAKDPLILPARRKHFNAPDPTDSCDVIVFRDGTETRAKVTEINPTEVKYRRCEMLNGPVFVASKSSIFMVKFASGMKQVFEKSEPKETSPNSTSNGRPAYKGKPELNMNALFSFIFGITGLVFGIGILSLLLGNLALKQIEQEPGRYKGKTLAQIGRTIGIIKLSLLALVIMLLVVSLILM